MKTKTTQPPAPVEKDDRGRSQAVAQLESIKEMISALEGDPEKSHKPDCAQRLHTAAECTCGKDDLTREEAEQRIQEDPLSIEVRSGWHTPGGESSAEEFMILLCTGGPACRIIGSLGQGDEPENPRLEYQDWFTPWTPLPLTSEDTEAVLAYCRCFYFGS